MPLVSISEAIKLAGISRQNFYDNYIKTNALTVNRENPKRPLIDTSEILRVFGKLDGHTDIKSSNHTESDTTKRHQTDDKIAALEAEIMGLRELAEERKARLEEKDTMLAERAKEIEYQRERVQSLEARYDRLLEDKREKDGLAHQLIERLDKAEGQKKGFWGRVAAVFVG